jgi:hypothetical protein
VTVKEQPHELVDRLPSEEAIDLLRFAESLQTARISRPRLPDFVGMGDSGRTDISENTESILRAGFGQ